MGSRAARLLLPVLVLASGFCGISYEILYAKLLGNLLGNQFTITASVLLTFLLGIGLGTRWAHHWARWLWAIEAGIGVYAGAFVLGYDAVDRLLYSVAPSVGTSQLGCALVAVLLLAAPAFLVGCSVPLFAACLGTLRSELAFARTYAIYNLGAASTAVALEFVLLRTIGLRAATASLAALNVVVASSLLVLGRRAVPVSAPPRVDDPVFPRNQLGALALASVASAIFQLLMIKIAECIFGPFRETFSLVLAIVLLGLALGSLAAGRFGLSFRGALLLATGGVAALVLLLGPAASLYAWLRPSAVASYPLLVGLKLGLVGLLMGLPAIGFGATIPALLRTYRNVARESGQLLFVSSLGNVAGFVLMAFVLHERLTYGLLLVLVAALAAAAVGLQCGVWARSTVAAAGIALVALLGYPTVWSEALLYYGHTQFHSPEDLRESRTERFAFDPFKGRQDVFAIIWRDGSPYFFINGYISIPLSNPSEIVVGAISSMLAPRTDDALVLGVGSGATAGTVGLVFDRTDAVEINPVVLDNLWRMQEYNFDIENIPNLHIVHDDGIHFIRTAPRRYSLILNTVTSPLYFSSSNLYTVDFFRHVAARLTPDGVYITWIDSKIGDRGVDIVLESLQETFEECAMAYVKSSYFLLACSAAPIAPRQVEAVSSNARLREHLSSRHGLPVELARYSLFAVDAFALATGSAPAENTLDFPVLEHDMAQLERRGLPRFHRLLARRLDLARVAGVEGGDVAWDAAEFALWADLRLPWDGGFSLLLRQVALTDFPFLAEQYAATAARHAAELGGAEANHSIGYSLYKRGYYETAIDLLSAAAELDPSRGSSFYYMGRCYERLGESALAIRSYRAALAVDAEDLRSREAVERLSRAPIATGS